MNTEPDGSPSKKRLWILTSETLPEYTGGIARYIENVVPCLTRAGCEVTVVSRTSGDTRDERRAAADYHFFRPAADLSSDGRSGRSAARYPYNVIGYWPGLSFQAADVIEKLLSERPAPDAIEVQDYGALGYYLLQNKLLGSPRLAGVPIYVHLHGPSFDLGQYNHLSGFGFPEYWIGRMERYAILAADGVLSPSRFLADRVAIATGLNNSIQVIPYPTPTSLDNVVSPSAKPSGYIAYFGRIELRKGVRELLEGCERLWAEVVDFKIKLAGNDTIVEARGEGLQSYLERRHRLAIESKRIEFVGALHGDSLLQFLDESRAVIVPSLWENFPNTCIEAMSLGKPVLVSASGGQKEMLGSPGHDGLLFDWSIANSFEDNLLRLLKMNEEELCEMGRRAKATISKICSAESVANWRLEHIAALKKSHRPRDIFPSPNPEWKPNPKGNLNRVSGPVPLIPARMGEVSVIIPYFNLGKLLGETLTSVRQSTLMPCEIIIVDDGSTDQHSLNVLENLSGDPLVRVIRQRNQGLAEARNTGARAAAGEYVCFVDADDCIDPGYLNRCVSVLRRYQNVGFVYSWVQWFEGAEEVWPTWNAELPYLAGHNMLTAFAVVRRDVFLKHGYNQAAVEYSLEDWEGWLSIVEAGWVGVAIPECLVRYRIRAGSMMRKTRAIQIQYLFRLVADLHPAIYQHYGAELFLLQNSNGPARIWNHPCLAQASSPETEIAELREDKDRLWSELQTLATSWQSHVKYIESQNAMLQQRPSLDASDYRKLWEEQRALWLDVEARNLELLDHLKRRANASPEWDSYVGGQFVRKLKSFGVVRLVIQSPRVQRRIARWLRL